MYFSKLPRLLDDYTICDKKNKQKKNTDTFLKSSALKKKERVA